MVGREQGFEPALLGGLVLGGELVHAAAGHVRLAPDHGEGEALVRLAELHAAALQHQHAQQLAL